MSYHEAFVASVGGEPERLCETGPCFGLIPDENFDYHRDLADSKTTTTPDAPKWKMAYTTIVLVLMLILLISDKYGPDAVMMAALAAFLAGQIVTVKQGVEGFSSEGVLTVLVLFVVAEGVMKTGALDWYMTRLLGRPKTIASAQFRLMVPCCTVSAFFNNSPIVLVMIPIIQRWCRETGLSRKQLLIPMSFSVVLGGTITLLGTSTNLVVTSLLTKRYPKDESVQIGMFDLTPYGVPVALIGMSYMLLAAPFLLPEGGQRGSNSSSGTSSSDMSGGEELLLGARVTKWSPAADRTIKRSGLRDTGGIYLVSVHRAATGNIHRAVSNDFVLNVGDILYFTGHAESFGNFCTDHALEMVTTELVTPDNTPAGAALPEDDVPKEIGVTKESLLDADEGERLRCIHRMTDMIRNSEKEDGSSEDPAATTSKAAWQHLRSGDPAQVVVAVDFSFVLVGIDAQDRPGLLLDVSKALLRLKLQLRHTEATAVHDRSISVWRCEAIDNEDVPDVEEIWSVLSSLLSSEGGVQAVKKRGQRVIRAVVTTQSRLVGKTAAQMNFRELYNAAIVALQKGDHTLSTVQKQLLSAATFGAGDILLLQVSDGSPLLRRPPATFYETSSAHKEESVVQGLVNKVRGSIKTNEAVEVTNKSNEYVDEEHGSNKFKDGQIPESDTVVWNDLKVLFKEEGDRGQVSREFLTAMIVAPKSQLVGKSVAHMGITRLPDLYLVSIDRPVPADDNERRKKTARLAKADDDELSDKGASVKSVNPTFDSIDTDEPLQEGDVLWYSGPASAIGDLRKIPGLISSVDVQVQKMNQKLHDRRMVQAVISRSGPLVGKTVKEVQFRTQYGAAVIAIHRDGNRVHELPGKVKLQAGDVLLLEAGPNFVKRSSESDRSFALLVEIKDSAPPRLSMLFPALFLVVGMIAFYAADFCSLLTGAMTAATIMVATGILSEQEARNAVKWDIYVAVSAAFGIGNAMTNSGVARAIASFLVDVGRGLQIGDAGVLGAVYCATVLVCNVIQNNAAAALTFPVAMDAAEKAGMDRVLMAFTVMFGASASFSVPFAYTTNLLIYGPGGYTPRNFFVHGAPMQIVLLVATTAILVVIRPWYVSWLIAGAIFTAVAGGRLLSSAFRSHTQDAQIKEETELVEMDATAH